MNSQDRMMNKKWGIFNHYLYYSEKGYTDIRGETDQMRLMAEEWNEQVDSFDAEKLAETLHEIGCGYYIRGLCADRHYQISGLVHDISVNRDPSFYQRYPGFQIV